MSITGLMGGDLGDLYPGSKERRAPNAAMPASLAVHELGPGKMMLVSGVEVEFFDVGQLAAALNRQSGTIRGWEREGILPTSGWTKPGKNRDVRGRRRQWTRGQVEGIVRIAIEEGVFTPGARVRITETQFTERVRELFNQLRARSVK